MDTIMKLSAAILILGLTSLDNLAFAAVGKPMADDPQSAVTVDVYAQHSGGKITYHYRVVNSSQQDIDSVSIGLDTQNDGNPNNDIYELYELPSGWNLKFGIPSTSSNSPTGWRVSISRPEDSPTLAVTWEPLNENMPRLLAGQTMAKMSIAVDKTDTQYLTGHALVTFTGSTLENLSVPIKRLDNKPPSFTVKLNPSLLQSLNNKLVPVKASFTIKDDYDRKPEIKLESITANEPVEPDDISDASIGLDDRYLLLRASHKGDADRIYTVTYSATDASGNQTLASATVSVPHNQTEMIKPEGNH
jgi:hypothetical protein